MLKLLFSIENIYHHIPKYVQQFSIKQVGNKYYLYAKYSLGRKGLIGRYDRLEQAQTQRDLIENLRKNI